MEIDEDVTEPLNENQINKKKLEKLLKRLLEIERWGSEADYNLGRT